MKKITTLFSVQGQSGQPMNALLIGRLTGIVLIVCFTPALSQVSSQIIERVATRTSLFAADNTDG
jgi:hypothetical protein